MFKHADRREGAEAQISFLSKSNASARGRPGRRGPKDTGLAAPSGQRDAVEHEPLQVEIRLAQHGLT